MLDQYNLFRGLSKDNNFLVIIIFSSLLSYQTECVDNSCCMVVISWLYSSCIVFHFPCSVFQVPFLPILQHSNSHFSISRITLEFHCGLKLGVDSSIFKSNSVLLRNIYTISLVNKPQLFSFWHDFYSTEKTIHSCSNFDNNDLKCISPFC